MTYDKALNSIFSRLRFGSKPGLKRIEKLLCLLCDPQKSLKFVHIAGTNGKGSCCAYLACALQNAGYKTGLYTSPYVCDFRERIQINGEMISKRDLAGLANKVLQAADSLNDDPPTEFEIITALAFLYFREKDCDIVILETGLGGRFDATNIISSPICSVITSISLDHTAVLGDTIPKIAFEKAGIIKKNSACILYSENSDDAVNVIKEKCRNENSALFIPEKPEIKESGERNRFIYKGKEYITGLCGAHQIYNAALSLEAMEYISENGFNIPEECRKAGLMNAFLPARCEILSENPTVILDGGHNIEGISALCEFIKAKKRGRVFALFGVLKDKDYKKMIPLLCGVCDGIICITPDNPRALPAEETAKEAGKYIKDAEKGESFEKALKKLISKTGKDDTAVICGSLYSAGKMKKLFLKMK